MTGNATITEGPYPRDREHLARLIPATGLRAAAGTGNTAVTGGHVPRRAPGATAGTSRAGRRVTTLPATAAWLMVLA
jgi:hypothetical protein